MPNIGLALAGGSLVGGVVFLLALWAYEEYQRSHQRERREAYGSSGESSGYRPRGSRSSAPPQPHNDCSICRDGLSAPLEILPCAHIFHRKCIKKWFERRMVCPVCRTRIPDELVSDYTQRLEL